MIDYWCQLCTFLIKSYCATLVRRPCQVIKDRHDATSPHERFPRNAWINHIENSRVMLNGNVVNDPDSRMKKGDKLEASFSRMHDRRSPLASYFSPLPHARRFTIWLVSGTTFSSTTVAYSLWFCVFYTVLSVCTVHGLHYWLHHLRARQLHTREVLHTSRNYDFLRRLFALCSTPFLHSLIISMYSLPLLCSSSGSSRRIEPVVSPSTCRLQAKVILNGITRI